MAKLNEITELTAITDDDLMLVMNDPASALKLRVTTVATQGNGPSR